MTGQACNFVYAQTLSQPKERRGHRARAGRGGVGGEASVGTFNRWFVVRNSEQIHRRGGGGGERQREKESHETHMKGMARDEHSVELPVNTGGLALDGTLHFSSLPFNIQQKSCVGRRDSFERRQVAGRRSPPFLPWG